MAKSDSLLTDKDRDRVAELSRKLAAGVNPYDTGSVVGTAARRKTEAKVKRVWVVKASTVRLPVDAVAALATDKVVKADVIRKAKNQDRRDAAARKRLTKEVPADRVRKAGFMGCVKRRAEQQVLEALVVADRMTEEVETSDDYHTALAAERNAREEQCWSAEHAANELLKAAGYYE